MTKSPEEKAEDAKRKREERQRYRDAGLVSVTVYVKPEDRQAIRALADKLNSVNTSKRCD